MFLQLAMAIFGSKGLKLDLLTENGVICLKNIKLE